MKQFIIFHKIGMKNTPKTLLIFGIILISIFLLFMGSIIKKTDALKIGLIINDESEELELLVNIFKNEDSLKRIAKIEQIDIDSFVKEYDVVIEIAEGFFYSLDHGKKANLNINYIKEDIRTDMLTELIFVVEDVVNASWSAIDSVNSAVDKYNSTVSKYDIMNDIAFNYASKIITRKTVFENIHLSAYGKVSKTQHIYSLIMIILLLTNTMFMIPFFTKDTYIVSGMLDKKMEGYIARLALIAEINILFISINLVISIILDKYIFNGILNVNIDVISFLNLILLAVSMSIFINLVFISCRKNTDAIFVFMIIAVITISTDVSFISSFKDSFIMTKFASYFPTRFNLDLLKNSIFSGSYSISMYVKIFISDILLLISSIFFYCRRVKNETI